MVVEILSESTRDYDLQKKREAYREGSIPEIWFVDDENHQIIVDRKVGEDYREEVACKGKVFSEAIDGFWVQAEWLWEESLPDPVACLRQTPNGLQGDRRAIHPLCVS